MIEQNYSNHRRFVPMFHVVLFLLIFATTIGSLVNLYASLNDHERLYSASLLFVMSICFNIIFWLMRAFPARVQDRAIRAEENLRYYVLTGKLLDPRLKIGQIIALRFAPDDELIELAKRAVEEGLTNDEIKKAIKNWKADHHRQ
jgi:hypothetical protein